MSALLFESALASEWQEVEIPLPPTANHLWFIVGRRQVASAAYKQWLQLATAAMRQYLVPIEGEASVSIIIYGGKGFSKVRDLDNCIKPILDALCPPVHHKLTGQLSRPGAGILQGDSIKFLFHIGIEYREPDTKKDEATCVVKVRGI